MRDQRDAVGRRQVENLRAQIDQDANQVAGESIRVFIDDARGRIQTLGSGSPAIAAAQRGETYDAARVALFMQKFVAHAQRAAFAPSRDRQTPAPTHPR